MKAIRNLFAKLFSKKKTQTVTEVKQSVQKQVSIRKEKSTVADKYSPTKLAWNGFIGTNENKKRHFNKKRHGQSLKRKHRLAA